MESSLYYNTITVDLKIVLEKLMQMQEFDGFRLVGGTSLSLQLGHRMSEDIDLFSDMDYGTMDIERITNILKQNFDVVEYYDLNIVANGRAFKVGKKNEKTIKVDVNYTDTFIFPELLVDGIRMASLEEIAAMKLGILLDGGRKKDYWDIHELLDHFTFKQMIAFHEKKYYSDYSYSHWKSCLIDFHKTDDVTDPECLRGKYWELIKLDLMDIGKK